jgi:hypothetical protein
MSGIIILVRKSRILHPMRLISILMGYDVTEKGDNVANPVLQLLRRIIEMMCEITQISCYEITSYDKCRIVLSITG